MSEIKTENQSNKFNLKSIMTDKKLLKILFPVIKDYFPFHIRV